MIILRRNSGTEFGLSPSKWRALSETKAPFRFVRCDLGLMHELAYRRMWQMPTVLRIGPYRFHFYSRESNEPPHIHVSREDFEVKFWLRPVSPAFNYGFPAAELNDIRRLVEQNCDFLVEAYRQFHGNR